MNIGLGEIHFAGLHVVDCRNNGVCGGLVEVLHVFLVLSVVQGARIHTDGVLEGIFEENLVEVTVETESIDSAVLMESGNIDADDILFFMNPAILLLISRTSFAASPYASRTA